MAPPALSPAVRRLLSATLFLLVASIAAAGPAAAEPGLIPLEPPQDLLELPGNVGNLAPDVVMRPDGGSVAAWIDPDDRLLGRWLGPPRRAGDPEGGVFLIHDSGPGLYRPRIVRGDDGYLAVWIHSSDGGSVISARAFDGEGHPLGPEVPVLDSSGTFDVAPLPGGGYAMVAHLYVSRDGPSRQLRFLAADGSTVGPPVEIKAYKPGTFDTDFQVAVEPDGRVMVSWSENVYSTRKASIQVRSFSPNGGALGPARQVGPEEYDPDGIQHDLAAIGTGLFLVAWAGDAPGDFTAPRAITVLEVDAWGVSGAAHRVDAGEGQGRRTGEPRIAFAADGTGVVAWTEGDYDLQRAVARRVDANGQPHGDPFLVAMIPNEGYLFSGLSVDRVPGRTVLGWGTATVRPDPNPWDSVQGGAKLTPPPVIIEPVASPLQRLRDDVPPPPEEPPLATGALPGFRTWVVITGLDGQPVVGSPEEPCIPETLCVSGRVPGRSEVFVRIVGPKPNGRLWPTVVKFSTSRVEVWIEQIATGDIEYYRLEGAAPGIDELPGLFDREGFEP